MCANCCDSLSRRRRRRSAVQSAADIPARQGPLQDRCCHCQKMRGQVGRHLLTFTAAVQLCPVSTSRVELTARVDGDRFPLPVNTGRQHGPSTQLVETRRPSTRHVLTGNGDRSPVNSGR